EGNSHDHARASDRESPARRRVLEKISARHRVHGRVQTQGRHRARREKFSTWAEGRSLMPPLAPGCVRECRGCGHRELSPEESLAQKTEWLERTLGRFGPIEPIRHDSARWGYRRKSTLRCERRDDRFAI